MSSSSVPASADNEDSVCDYLGRLAKVQDKVGDKLLIVPRIYTNKPRTTGQGYKGMLHQPDPEKKSRSAGRHHCDSQASYPLNRRDRTDCRR